MQNPSESNLSDFFGHFKKYLITMRLNTMFSCTRPYFNMHKNSQGMAINLQFSEERSIYNGIPENKFSVCK